MKKAISLLLSIIIIISIINIAVISTSAIVIGDDYPSEYRSAAQDTLTDRWNFWNRECTSFVAWRMDSQNGIHDFNNTHLTVDGKYYNVYLGHAYNWGSALQSVGFAVNTTPAVGSIAWTSNGQYGHVAWVADVSGDNVTVEEYNVYPNVGAYNYPLRTMTVSEWINNGYKFIHVKDLKCTSHKWNSGKVTTKPTCKKDGVKTYTCTVCGEKKTETIKHSSKYHNYKVSKCIKATLHTNGKLIKKCTHCGKTVKSTIYRPKTIKLKKTKFVYNGKKKKPAVVVKNTKGKEISSKYYNVTFTGNKKVGKAAAKISFKTRYSGAVKRYFAIIPKGTSLSKLKAGSKSFTAKWKKQTSQTTGYQLQYATNSKFTKSKKTIAIKSAKTVSKKIKKLKASKKYYVRVRTYKKVKGILYPSVWSKSLTVKTKKAADAKSVLLKKIKTNLDITKVFYADYDGDGKKELFAVCGDIGNDISSFGEREIWFVSTKQTKCDNLSTMIYSAKCVKVNSKQKMFIAETGAGGSGSSSIWYYVKAGKRKGNTFPFSGLTQIKKNQFKVTLHDFDNYALDTGKPMGGHTYRQYYFKWTGTKFLEYKGTLISQKQLKKYKNGASIINKIKKLGYSIDTIYKRKNGVININVHIATNYEHELRYENVNLKLSNNKVSVIVTYKGGKDIVGKSSFGGIYKANLVFY